MSTGKPLTEAQQAQQKNRNLDGTYRTKYTQGETAGIDLAGEQEKDEHYMRKFADLYDDPAEGLEAIADYLDWKINIWDEDAELETWSPAGENLVISAPCMKDGKIDPATFAAEIRDYADNFDPEQHAANWYGANRGEPQSLRSLLADADAIKEQYEELAACAGAYAQAWEKKTSPDHL